MGWHVWQWFVRFVRLQRAYSGWHPFSREIVNYCCLCNPNVSFFISVYSIDDPTYVSFDPYQMFNGSPFLPPRPGAVKFWELEVGQPTNGLPTFEELAAALGDSSNSQRRWAAEAYWQATEQNYPVVNLTSNKTDAKSAWAALAFSLRVDPWHSNSYFSRRRDFGIQPVFSSDPGLNW